MGLNSKSAANLLLLTCAVESNLGHHLKQVNGPALGIYQMEPKTASDIYENFLDFRPELKESVDRFKADNITVDDNLTGNLFYATAMARVHYYRVPEELPHHEDIAGLASYWKSYYNTPKGKGTVEQAILKYKTLVLDKL